MLFLGLNPRREREVWSISIFDDPLLMRTSIKSSDSPQESQLYSHTHARTHTLTMDIRSLLNDKDLAPKPSTAQKSGDAHSVVIPHLRSPIDIDCRGSWHTQQSTADRYIRNDSVHKRDSMSFSPKSEHAQPSGDLDSAPKSLPCYQCQKLFTRRSDLVRHGKLGPAPTSLSSLALTPCRAHPQRRPTTLLHIPRLWEVLHPEIRSDHPRACSHWRQAP